MKLTWALCGVAALGLGAPASASAAERTTRIQVIDEVTALPVAGATVFVEGQGYAANANGVAQVQVASGGDSVTASVAYQDGTLRRIETLHDLALRDDIILRVPYGQGIRREAVFSVSVPFGPIQRQAKAMLLLPQPAYESGGLNFGHFDQVRLYQDQLQDDGRFSLMVVALDDGLVPWKFGYMLDLMPQQLDNAHVMFGPPMTTGVDQERQLVYWRKLADPLSASDASASCDFTAPPFTECGLYPDKGGIFSWINVWRKGQLFHTPGAFLPARTVGANPLMALPDAQIELVGHDDPKGFAPFNYARHRYLRFDAPPAGQVDVAMPTVLIGSADQPGAQAITLDGSTRGARFVVQAAGEGSQDVDNLDLGKVQLIWAGGKDGARTIWNQHFAPRAGENVVGLLSAAPALMEWLPSEQEQKFENVQVWLYGSDGVDGYAHAWALRMQGEDPMRRGTSAFQVTRWR